ncbi:MAG: hypothetical protein ACM3NQ_12375, partial [Bacteroidales bacterium]
LKDRDERLERLRHDVRAGLDVAAAGDYEDYDDRSITRLGDAVKARGRERLAKQPKRTRR